MINTIWLFIVTLGFIATIVHIQRLRRIEWKRIVRIYYKDVEYLMTKERHSQSTETSVESCALIYRMLKYSLNDNVPLSVTKEEYAMIRSDIFLMMVLGRMGLKTERFVLDNLDDMCIVDTEG